MLRRVHRTLFALSLSMLALACNGKATRAQCNEMLDKYLDMTIESDPDLANLPRVEANAAREMKKALRKSEPAYKKVHEQCEAEISKHEYRCAMKASSPETWQACID